MFAGKTSGQTDGIIQCKAIVTDLLNNHNSLNYCLLSTWNINQDKNMDADTLPLAPWTIKMQAKCLPVVRNLKKKENGTPVF